MTDQPRVLPDEIHWAKIADIAEDGLLFKEAVPVLLERLAAERKAHRDTEQRLRAENERLRHSQFGKAWDEKIRTLEAEVLRLAGIRKAWEQAQTCAGAWGTTCDVCFTELHHAITGDHGDDGDDEATPGDAGPARDMAAGE